ncbi:MAG: site-specific integrase [Chloroflexi bacterium]|nr:site-specific integrase [Chloroflexota bacterium]
MSTALIDTRTLGLAELGRQANDAAQAGVFADYQARRAANTLRRHRVDLATFAQYLNSDAAHAHQLATDPQSWAGITWGLIDGFAKWALLQGYAVGTVNLKLSTVKTYASLAAKAGVLDAQELAMIRMVAGYSHAESKRVNEKREQAGISTRMSDKKQNAIVLSKAQADKLKTQPDTPQGRRDRLLVCIMLDLGLRVGEVALLTVDHIDLKQRKLVFYRPKVTKVQTHTLVGDLQTAMADYAAQDAPASGPLLRASRKGGHLTQAGMSERAITARVRWLGEQMGVAGLSAHDLRHTWATHAARNGTALDRLQDAGGWNSLAMPARYVEAAKIANEGVRL